ncbi:hypothetical protein FRB95_008890 [Tulasnella sp. JGI-2019a]|nr:hypothetical protein FRB95_008890 [Tulasnella sp. JGI-2019a]
MVAVSVRRGLLVRRGRPNNPTQHDRPVQFRPRRTPRERKKKQLTLCYLKYGDEIWNAQQVKISRSATVIALREAIATKLKINSINLTLYRLTPLTKDKELDTHVGIQRFDSIDLSADPNEASMLKNVTLKASPTDFYLACTSFSKWDPMFLGLTSSLDMSTPMKKTPFRRRDKLWTIRTRHQPLVVLLY